MKVLWKCSLLAALALCSVSCAGGGGGSVTGAPPTAGTAISSPATVSALASSPGAGDFLARTSFSGVASVNDRALAQNRYLVFTSRLDLIPTDTNGRRDVYWRDLRTGEMKVISRASDGTQGNADSSDASISENGRYVVFRSLASNLVAGMATG